MSDPLTSSKPAITSGNTQLDGLHRIIRAANSTHSLATALQTVAETVSEVMQVDVCSICLYDLAHDRLYLRATQGLEPAAVGKVSLAIGEGITGLAAEEGQPIIVADVEVEARFHVDPLLREKQWGSMVAVPIILFDEQQARGARRDRLQGVITIQQLTPRAFSEEEVHFLEVVAGELAFFVSNRQRYEHTDERLQQKVRELATLQRVTAAIAATLDVQEVLSMIAEQAVNLSQVERADIFQSDESGEEVELLASYGGESDLALGHAILRMVAYRGDSVGTFRPRDSRDNPELAEVALREGYQSVFCIPLRSGQRMIGVITLYARDGRDFDYESIQLLSSFADAAAIALENARLFKEVRRALHTKEALLRELDHRVGNNLSAIKGLLTMRRRRLEPDSPAAAALEQSISQIETMAGVQTLLRGERHHQTSLGDIARRVIQNKVGLEEESAVDFRVVGEEIAIPARDATVIALVINEFVDNALRHGVAMEGGRIEVEGRVEDGVVVLEVRDDGPQHPMVPAPDSSGRGHSIIRSLVTEGFGGDFEFQSSDQWTVARVRLPHSATEG